MRPSAPKELAAPNELATMERLFQDGLLGRSRGILAHVQGNAREDAAAMFGIYQHAYWARLVESLGIDFPGLKALLGEAEFDRLARAYIGRHPSLQPSIRWAGRRLAEFLSVEPGYRDDPWLADMARFDWALAHAFDAADAPIASRADLAALPPEFWGGLRLALHPSLDVFAISTPVDAVRPLLLADAATTFDRDVRRNAALMVWRLGYDLKFRAIEPTEQEALATAQAGASFGEICEFLATRMEAEQAVVMAAQILQGWLEWGVIHDFSHDAPVSAA
jgi:hypothetical protein